MRALGRSKPEPLVPILVGNSRPVCIKIVIIITIVIVIVTIVFFFVGIIRIDMMAIGLGARHELLSPIPKRLSGYPKHDIVVELVGRANLRGRHQIASVVFKKMEHTVSQCGRRATPDNEDG